MKLEKLEQQLKGNDSLGALADSPEGKALASRIDESALRDAAKRGDTTALQSILQQVLSTPEGKALADKVQKAVGKQ